MNYLGKVLFPRLQPWQRRRQLKISVVALMVGVTFAAIVGGMILYSNSRHV